jgi:hypothetical protein
MAIESCRECNSNVSTEALSCPHCGAPRPTARNWTGPGYEWKSQATVWGIPLVHVAFGRDSRGRIRTAKGIIAVGQFGVGLITVAQFGVGILLGCGQFILGLMVIAQFAGALLVGIGQFATGVVAIGQLVVGIYGLCQSGIAKYLWSTQHTDMEAVAMFHTLYLHICRFVGYPGNP